ncbi:MAG: GNAT family N-acetyltransferase [Planctomycetes bacterium]|nr:GNAT family N-acetyltransferase [Planctomycetota bacterium]
MTLRETPRPSDRDAVRRIVSDSGFFHPSEVDVAVELVDEALARGAEASGYHFVFADDARGVAGYACFGPIAGTESSFDLYWIAVDPERRGLGLGSTLLDASERRIASLGGRRVYVETSSKELYVPTRGFYEARGYVRQAHLPDFYAPGDGKVIYVRELATP